VKVVGGWGGGQSILAGPPADAGTAEVQKTACCRSRHRGVSIASAIRVPPPIPLAAGHFACVRLPGGVAHRPICQSHGSRPTNGGAVQRNLAR